MSTQRKRRPWLWLISFIGVIVPGSVRADWRQEWIGELSYREELLDQWEQLNWRTKTKLAWLSAGAFWDACGCKHTVGRTQCFRMFDMAYA